MRESCHITMLLFLVITMAGAARAVEPPASRIGISAGMGVNYLTQRDLVDMINGAYSPGKRVDEFHAAVDFFGSVVVPISTDWALRAEYAYLLNTYNIASLLGPGDFTTVLHMPSLIVEYILVDEEFYDVSGGLGGGYHVGVLDLKYSTIDDSYTATGPGMVMMLNGNTALGEDLFVHLAVNARWEFLGELRNANDRSPGKGAEGDAVKLGSFGVGARIGVSYYF
jgi:hypothetical protein